MTRRGLAPRQRVATAGHAAALARTAIACVCALAAAACASVQPASSPGGDVLSGRLALRIAAVGNEAPRAFAANFDLRGDAQRGTLDLATPLGTMLGEARWSPAEVVLVTPQGTRRFADLDALTREALGESVPVEAWFDWLRGRPWPGAPSEPSAATAFAQLGWTVDLADFAQGSVVAMREWPAPAVIVRIRLDRS